MNNPQRSRELKILARENGWLFQPAVDPAVIPAIAKFEFHTGEKRTIKKIENLIAGANFSAFDVYWQGGFDPLDAAAAMTHKDSSARQIRQQTLFVTESADLDLPKFHVYPADALSTIDRWLDKAFRRVSFSGYPEFEKRWSVRGDSRKVTECFSERVIEFYLKKSDFRTFAVDNYIFIYQPNVLTSTSRTLDLIKTALELSDIFNSEKGNEKWIEN
jgi:hypothetical protein